MTAAIEQLIRLFRSLWRDKRLTGTLAFQDFRRRYAGSYFGTVWGFVQPLLTIIVYWVVFQFGFRSGDIDGVPYALWFVCGIVPWLFVSEAITTASHALIEYSYLVKKVVFNVDILPLVKVLSAGCVHVFFVALLVVIGWILGCPPSLYTVQIIYYMLCAVLLVFAVCLFTSAIIVFFRDLSHVIQIVLLVGMWGTPIAWNPAMFSERAQTVLKLNPVYYIVSGYRDAIIGGAWPWDKWLYTLYFWVLLLLLLCVGSFVFHRLKPHFADVL